MIIHVTLERDSKGRWEITFQGPKQGGALKISKSLKTAMQQLAKVLLKEFPDPLPKSDLLIPPIVLETDPEEPQL